MVLGYPEIWAATYFFSLLRNLKTDILKSFSVRPKAFLHFSREI